MASKHLSRRIVQAALVLAGGVMIAFGVMTLGCGGSSPPLGTMCGHNLVLSLLVVAVASWFVLALVVVLANELREKR